jgi:hypothetical protein
MIISSQQILKYHTAGKIFRPCRRFNSLPLAARREDAPAVRPVGYFFTSGFASGVTSSSSTSNTSVALGGIIPPAPRSP